MWIKIITKFWECHLHPMKKTLKRLTTSWLNNSIQIKLKEKQLKNSKKLQQPIMFLETKTKSLNTTVCVPILDNNHHNRSNIRLKREAGAMINNLMETPSVSNVLNTTDRGSSMGSSNSNTSSSNNMRSLLKVKKEVVTPTTGPMMVKSIIRTTGVSGISLMIISKGSRKS
jgi:hypothetical protein